MNVFFNMLTGWQWGLLAAIPLAILSLYFLKLRREPVPVSSTYLWRRSIEDLHVNSLWQKLRQSLLLYLQLLLVGLLILACLRPSWQSQQLLGNRFIFLLDNSASMSATDELPSRLEMAKKRAEDTIRNQLKPGDTAMIISFSDSARVEQPFTTDHMLLLKKLAAVQPTQRPTDLTEALRAAAGLANPGRTPADSRDRPAADAQPAELLIFSDGGLAAPPDFSMGNLRPVYIPSGKSEAENVAIQAFQVTPRPKQPDQLDVFARLENHANQDRMLRVALHVDEEGQDRLLDFQEVNVAAHEGRSVEFQLQQLSEGVFRLVVEDSDHLALDNVAHCVVNAAHPAEVLLVTPGNEYLQLALNTADIRQHAKISVTAPDALLGETYQKAADRGDYDLVIYDQCAPPQLPQANTLLLGRIPPTKEWAALPAQATPQIIDVDRSHPLMYLVEMSDVLIAEGTPIKGPQGNEVLVDSDVGPLFVIGPREGFRDVVVGFELAGKSAQGESYRNTDWPWKLSFPLFIKNIVEQLGRPSVDSLWANVRPGQEISLRATAPVEEIDVECPDGEHVKVARGLENRYLFGKTHQLGVYQVREGGASAEQVDQRFAVNLFNAVESDIRPRPVVETAYDKIEAQRQWVTAKRDVWRWLIGAALLVVLIEWFIYHRRVYI